MTKNGWLTPDSLPGTIRQCVLSFPDSEAFQSILIGALSLLADEKNYEEFGALSAVDTSDAFRQTLFDFLEEDCVLFPIGGCLDWPSNDIPDGFLDTNQSAVSRVTYAKLFAVIGTTWGAGDGSTTFDLPHKDGRVTVGKKPGDADFDTLGETGGSKTHTLTIAEMPAHKHDTRIVAGGSTQRFATNATGNNTFTTSQDMANAGGGGAHNNVQPYVVMNYIIRYR